MFSNSQNLQMSEPGNKTKPPSAILASKAERAGLHIRNQFAFRPDYAITLEKWLERFDAIPAL